MAHSCSSAMAKGTSHLRAMPSNASIPYGGARSGPTVTSQSRTRPDVGKRVHQVRQLPCDHARTCHRTSEDCLSSLLGGSSAFSVATAMVMGLLVAGLLIPAVGAAGRCRDGRRRHVQRPPGGVHGLPAVASSPRSSTPREACWHSCSRRTGSCVNLEGRRDRSCRRRMIAIEDDRFYEHGGGRCPRHHARGRVERGQGGDTQGASSLTQQYVKLTLQENALRNNDEEARQGCRRPERVPQDPGDASTRSSLEKRMTKDQILQRYLNLAYSATAPTASKPPRTTTSARRAPTSRSPRPPCSPAWCSPAGLRPDQQPGGREGPSQHGHHQDARPPHHTSTKRAKQAISSPTSTCTSPSNKNGCVSTQGTVLLRLPQAATCSTTPRSARPPRERKHQVYGGGLTIQSGRRPALPARSQQRRQRTPSIRTDQAVGGHGHGRAGHGLHPRPRPVPSDGQQPRARSDLPELHRPHAAMATPPASGPD